MKTAIYNKVVKKVARCMALGCLLLFFFGGNLMAQNDTPFVIKKGGNYLAHVKVEEDYVLQNAGTFNPSTCLWYSGPTYNPTGYTHNYYFEDDAHNLRFLAAPLEPNGALSLSASLPSVSLLRNTDQVYYFYNWDPETHLNGVPEGGGVARGKRYYVSTQEECQTCGDNNGASWYVPQTGNPQCWEVYWIENVGNEWKLSSASSYNITDNAAHYRKVTVTEHEKEITVGGLTTLTVPSELNDGGQSVLSAPVGSPYSYIPAYTNYVFLENGSESVHNYWGNTDHGGTPPGTIENVAIGSKNYQWTISGDGVEYLSFNSGSDVNTSTDESPTLYYRVQNNTGHKTATITVTVTYTANNEQTTQTLTATVLVKTPCQNPPLAGDPVVTYTGVTVSWLPTADSYEVSWKTGTEDWNTLIVEDTTSYTLTGLQFETVYSYKVKATCTDVDPDEYTFTTLKEPGLVVIGSIFGGGRMANVTGNTEVVIVNCDSIGNIFGGNDIAGEVQGDNGSKITLGVAANDPNNYDDYGTTPNNGKIRVTSVYGGGNGYYAYNGTSFEPATENYTSETVAPGASVNAMTQSHTVGDVVWTNTSSSAKTLYFPSIVKTAITVTNDQVKVDSIFGGAKNAFLTYSGTDDDPDGSLITINGGTIMSVFGGNNFGGDQGYGIHHIVVNGTTTNLALNIQNTPTTGYGRDFGIRYLFGGGNKVYGSTTDIEIFGGQTDHVFGGGNSADVYAANVRVDCSLGAYSSEHPYTYGNTYTNAIPTSYASGAISIKEDYPWDGKGIYNVRNLYGGNNMEHMATVPTVTLSSGSVGTVYGGGNAGDMLASSDGTIDENGDNVSDIFFDYSTKVILNSPNIIVDYVYGGCRMSNVDYSTWVQIQNGHVGTVFGGCNVSGDVGSTRVNPSAASGTAAYQEVQGGTYVEASGGTVYKNLFAGGNGFYHCNQNFHYVSGVNYTDENFVDKLVPSHNETYANVRTGATIKGNVYAGGNLAPVGFQDQVAPYFPSFPTDAVGWAVVHIYGGTIEGNVFGGGNMADIYGSNDVMVAGGTIAAVYGGNDRTGQVGEFSNRVLPTDYSYATDGSTILITPNDVRAYVRIVGNPTIQEVYGGGNGDYDYEHGDEVVHQYCDENESGPIQSNTFVDIHIDGGENGGHIGTVYGGGDGVTASGFITVFMNIVEPNPAEDYVNVNTVFGGNNKGDLDIVPNIILLHGQVGTVYGGCNEGAMTAATGISVGDYTNVGSYVYLRDSYAPIGNPTAPPAPTDIKISNAVYGGCRMNGVTRNSLVLVEGGDFSNALLFGGSDISGTVSGKSMVATVGGTVGNVYGGGNGNYDYEPGGNVYRPGSEHTPANLVATGITAAPTCAQSGADILGGFVGTQSLLGAGTVSRVFGAGYGKDTRTTGDVLVNVGRADAASAAATPTIYGEIYGGSALGNVNTAESADNHYTTTVNFLNGTLKKATVNEVDYGGNLFGGGLGRMEGGGLSAVPAKVFGKVYVNISNDTQASENCFIDLRDANIYGCNNTNGSPQDDVRVDVWKTGYTTDDYDSQTGTSYAIDQVFGGGNQADYRPVAVGEGQTPHLTHVYIHECLNTIRRVFSGGNAAYAEGVKATIEGGRFDYVFGGGNGEVNEANIGAGGTNLLVEAGIINHLFGGSNQTGSIAGPVNTTISGAHYVPAGESVTNPCNESITEFFGGSNQALLQNDVTTLIECSSGSFKEIYGGSKLADITGNVTLNIRGGTCTGEGSGVYGGSKGQVGDDPEDAADITGNVTLNLEGGKITDAFGGSNINGNITGNITVNVIDLEGECGLDLTNVYGGGNVTTYTPTSGSSVVNVIHIAQDAGIRGNVYGGGKGSSATVTANPTVNFGYNAATMSTYLPDGVSIPNNSRAFVSGSVFGGGDAAPVAGNTEINVYSGEIVQKLVGGGNAADITGNTTVNISGGRLCTDDDITKIGIYGGCNTWGTVTGDITLNITSPKAPNADTTVIGTITTLQYALDNSAAPVSVHGGGYGAATATIGNVTINYGVDDGSEGAENRYPKLYGDLYGGSALGTVNDDASDKTTVNVLNGSLVNKTKVVVQNNNHIVEQYGGYIYGGGLGDANNASDVNGVVHVNIGREGDATKPAYGKAYLKGCSVFGCNNTKGTPKRDVFVDVYQTAHEEIDSVHFDGGDQWNNYAMRNVYGGGNKADYLPLDNSYKAHNTVHYCNNTIQYVYGGGNAADTYGTKVKVDGGRFQFIFGGGNGQSGTEANIGSGGVDIEILSGHVGWHFYGCNLHGNIQGTISELYGCDPSVTVCPCDDLLDVQNYYFGANEALTVGGLEHTINCGDNMDFKNVYAGSRLAVVYGDVMITVRGGNIGNLFGGSEGSDLVSADIRKYPTDWQEHEDDGTYEPQLISYMRSHTGLEGTGGNVTIVLEGGKIGNVFGGNNYRGNIDGDITIIVDSTQINPCELEIDYIYGGNNLALYAPDGTTSPTNRISPEVYLKHGHVNGAVFGGSKGGNPSHNFGNGKVYSNPLVVIGDPSVSSHKVKVGDTLSSVQPHVMGKGDVFGGGNAADLTGSPTVYVQGKATIMGNVFGGGELGLVDGSTSVFIDPQGNDTILPPVTPIPRHKVVASVSPTGSGTVTMTVNNTPVSSGDMFPEGTVIQIMAVHSSGYIFEKWEINEDTLSTDPTTTYTVGVRDVVITAKFVEAAP